MPSYTICVPDIFPTVSAIQAAIRSIMPSTPIDFPGFNISLPKMPGMPSIPWDSIPSVNALLEMFGNQLANNQLIAVISAVYDTLASLFSLPFPSMPGLPGFDFSDLLSMDIEGLVNAVKNMLPGSLSLPGVPWPLFPSMSIPDMEILSAIQLTIGMYMGNMCNLLFAMVNGVADLLMLPTMPAIPSFPSISSIMAMLPEVPSLDDLKGLVFGAFGGLSLSLPSPLIPGFDCPQYDFIQGLKALYTGMGNYVLQLITDFVTSVLGLGLSLPTLCLPISF